MRRDQLVTLVGLCAPATVAAAATASSSAPGVVHMGITRTNRAAPPSSIRRRADTYTETLGNNVSYGGYFATVNVGTPAQSQDVILDTGSSDAWFLNSDASVCQTTSSSSSGPGDGMGGGPGGAGSASIASSSSSRRKALGRRQSSSSACVSTFDPSDSSSFSNTSLDFDISYVDGSTVSGYYFEDTLEIGGASVSSLQMGLASTSDLGYGILGIGFPGNEAAATEYPNLIDKFYSEGLIGSKSYSLYLDDLQSSTGTILFGGVDSDKYDGDLIAVPIIKDSSTNNYTSFAVTLSSLAAVDNSTGSVSKNYSIDPLAVILDSGTTLTYLPTTVAEEVMSTFNATYDSSLGYATCSCSLASTSNLYLEYQFGGYGGPKVQVSLSQLLLQISSSSSSTTTSSDSDCAFGVSESDSYYLLGDTFLRSAYVVYDLDNKEIALAQSNFNSTSTSVTAIAEGSSIPNVASTATAVMASSTGASTNGDTKKSGAAAASATAMASLFTTVVVAAGAVVGSLLIFA